MQCRIYLVLLLTFAAFSCADDPSDPFRDMEAIQDVGSADLGSGDLDMGFVEPDMAADLGRDTGPRDLGPDTGDAGRMDLGEDASLDLGPDLPSGPLGMLSGECGEIDMMELDSAQPFVFTNTIDFGTDPYDEADFMRLTMGAQEIINDGNAGGSSLYSEVFAYEVLARCEMATLLKTETEINYDMQGKLTDLLVEIDSRKIGVSVTRAVAFPRDSAYPASQAQSLLEAKLSDILESSANVASEDAWQKQILHVIADETRHRDALVMALQQIDAATRADTIVVISISEGSDDFLY